MWGKRHMKMKTRKWLPLFLFLALLLLVGRVFFSSPDQDSFSVSKDILVRENGIEVPFFQVAEQTVGEFLLTRNLALQEGETVFPPLETRLTPQTMISITRTHGVTFEVDGVKKKVAVVATSVEGALSEAGITLDEDDIVKPGRGAFVSEGTSISVIRVEITEETIEKAIAFEKKINEDPELSWRKKIVTQKGEKGLDHAVYRVSRHDGREVNRKLVRIDRIKEPVMEITTVGTYVKLGKSHTGGASWYAYTGTLAAANPWLPKGSYVKVTNTENGKSVIVVINDRGPFVPGRIIDLDKVAFQKIASPGSGVITVKMEEIVN